LVVGSAVGYSVGNSVGASVVLVGAAVVVGAAVMRRFPPSQASKSCAAQRNGMLVLTPSYCEQVAQ